MQNSLIQGEMEEEVIPLPDKDLKVDQTKKAVGYSLILILYDTYTIQS